jgi:Mrp family chromosome partitioning ATPase
MITTPSNPDAPAAVDAACAASVATSPRSDAVRRPVVSTLPEGAAGLLFEDGQDYFRALLRHLPWPADGATRPITTLGVTSCYRDEGVTTVAVNTALAAAGCRNQRVLVVDANLSHPSLHRLFEISATPGLKDVLLDQLPLDAVLCESSGGLQLLTAGQGDPARAYEATDRWRELFTQLKRNFDLVVVDLPAASEAGTAAHLFSLVDGVVLVVEHERVRWEAAQQKRLGLRRAKANLVGVVFNKRTEHIPGWLYRTL